MVQRMKIRDRIKRAPKATFTRRYVPGEGSTAEALAFDVELRAIARSDLDRAGEECFRQVFNERTRQYEGREPDPAKVRRFVCDVVLGWSGLTLGNYYALCHRTFDGGDGECELAVECTPDAVLTLAEESQGFADWVLRVAQEYVVAAEQRKEEAKNDSGDTSAAT